MTPELSIPIELTVGPAIARRATRDEIIAVRHAELRPGFPLEAAIFEGDDAPTTFHFGAFMQAAGSENIGCASFMLNTWQGEPAYQLRGMATLASLVHHGIGRAVLEVAERTLLVDTPVRLLWANARVAAIAFYRKHGWTLASDVFDIPTVGPHYRIIRSLI